MKNKIIFLFLFISLFFVYSQKKPDKILLAHEDKNAYPWVFPVEGKEGVYEGLDLIFLKIVGEKLGVKIEFIAYPWQRCLDMMKVNKVDGAFASSYKKEREEYGVYPKTKDGKIDENRRIHISGYSLYTLKNSKIQFDGKEFLNFEKGIGVQHGFSIIEPLQKFNVKLDIVGNADPISLLNMVIKKRFEATALQTARADNIIENDKVLKENIIKYPTDKPPFEQKAYYVMFSYDMNTNYKDFIEKFWDTCVEVRNSKEFKKAEEDFYKKY